MPEVCMMESTRRQVQLEPFDHQVGGHHSMLRYNQDTLCKPIIPREQLFYETLPKQLKEFTAEYRGVIEVRLHEDSEGYIKLIGYPQLQSHSNGSHISHSTSGGSDSEAEVPDTSLSNNAQSNRGKMKLLRSGSIEVGIHTAPVNPWSLKCHKEQVARMRLEKHKPHYSNFILLENVAAHFKYPCILDLKMGPRQHGDDASDHKREIQVAKCAATTSVSLGLRLCGMQVFQQMDGIYINRDKFYGRSVLPENFKDCLYQFLHNGQSLRTCVIEPIVRRLKRLYTELSKQQSFRFYSSSLLIMYEGIENTDSLSHDSAEDNGNSDDVSSNNESDECSPWDQQKGASPYVEIKMIDFAHATRKGFWDDEVIHKGPDSGYLFGLKNLIKFFTELHDEFGTGELS